MTWIKRGFLLVLVAIGILAISIYKVIYEETRYRIVGQYVDYDCRPVRNADYEFRASMSSRFPYSGGAQRRHAGQTDAAGRFEIEFESNGWLDRFDIAISQANDEREGFRQFDPEASLAALDSTESNPVYFYRQHPHTLDHRITDRTSVGLDYRADGGNWRHQVRADIWQRPRSAGRFRQQVVLDNMLRWQPDGSGWALTLVAHQQGGFVEYPVDRLPFEAKIPSQSFGKTVRMQLPTAENPVTRRAFYYRHNDGEAYGTLLINARYSNDEPGPSARLTVTHDLLASAPGSTVAPVLPQYSCGGTASRGMDESFLAPSKPRLDRQISVTRVDPAEARIAADPDTPIEWFRIRLDNPVVLHHALVSYGDVTERYPLIYHGLRDWLRGHLADPKPRRLINWRNNGILHIARDERTPPDILASIVIDFPVIPVAIAVSSNPNLPQDAVHRLAGGLLSGQYESVDAPQEELNTMRSLAANPRLSREQYEKLTKLMHNASDRGEKNRYGSAATDLLKNPGLPGEVLGLWTDRAIEKDLAWIVQHLLAHPHTAVGDLRRLGDKFFHEKYRGHRISFAQALDNKNLNHDMLAQFTIDLVGLSSREMFRPIEAYRALLHPNFDRQVLHDMLTVDNVRLVEGLLNFSKRELFRSWGPIARQFALPGEVIRYIYELPGSERFHQAIAHNFNTPLDILEEMMARNDGSLDRRLIQNASLPAVDLRTLQVRIPAGRAQKLLAENPGSPEDILLAIAEAGGMERSLLENPATPGTALETMYRQQSSAPERYLVRDRIKELLKHPNITTSLVDEVLTAKEETELVLIVARNPATDPALLEKIARREYTTFSSDRAEQVDKQINDALAGNPATPWQVKRKLRRY